MLALLEVVMAARQKVGVLYGQVQSRIVLRHVTNGDFVSVVDGVTFGVMEGRPFNSSVRSDWKPEDQIRWARAQAAFFRTIAENLDQYADSTARTKP